MGLFTCLCANAANIELDEPKTNLIDQKVSEYQYETSIKIEETTIEDDYFCRVCVTQYVPSVLDGTYIGFTACAGNMFTSCETATDKATEKLLIKVAKIFEDM